MKNTHIYLIARACFHMVNLTLPTRFHHSFMMFCLYWSFIATWGYRSFRFALLFFLIIRVNFNKCLAWNDTLNHKCCEHKNLTTYIATCVYMPRWGLFCPYCLNIYLIEKPNYNIVVIFTILWTLQL